MEITKLTTPVIQVARRLPRQAAMKNFPHRWTTMAKKKISTDHRCIELMNSPVPDSCHHWGPFSARMQPVRMITASAATVMTPNT